MTSNISHDKRLTARKLIGFGFLVWAVYAIFSVSQFGRYDEYSVADKLFCNQSNYTATTFFAGLLMFLSYGYILAARKEDKVLWPLSRGLIVLGIAGWFFVAFWDILYAFASTSLSSFRFAVWAYFYPSTTLIAYWLLYLVGWELLRRVLFVILCVALPLIQFYVGVEAAR